MLTPDPELLSAAVFSAGDGYLSPGGFSDDDDCADAESPFMGLSPLLAATASGVGTGADAGLGAGCGSGSGSGSGAGASCSEATRLYSSLDAGGPASDDEGSLSGFGLGFPALPGVSSSSPPMWITSTPSVSRPSWRSQVSRKRKLGSAPSPVSSAPAAFTADTSASGGPPNRDAGRHVTFRACECGCWGAGQLKTPIGFLPPSCRQCAAGDLDAAVRDAGFADIPPSWDGSLRLNIAGAWMPLGKRQSLSGLEAGLPGYRLDVLYVHLRPPAL